MASGLPPPPTKAADGSFAWVSWYNALYKMLSTTGSVAWALVNKAGSSIADLQVKGHDLLTGLQGGTLGEHYHLTAIEYTNISTVFNVLTKAGVPTISDISTGHWAVYKDTSGGTIKIYVNDGGTIKASAAFT